MYSLQPRHRIQLTGNSTCQEFAAGCWCSTHRVAGRKYDWLRLFIAAQAPAATKSAGACQLSTERARGEWLEGCFATQVRSWFRLRRLIRSSPRDGSVDVLPPCH